jgi:hypothetical protein
MSKAVPKQVKLLSQYHNVFNSPDGREVLYDMMRAHGFLSTNYKSGVSGDKDLLVLEGERNVIVRLLAKLNTKPADIMERIKQHEMAMGK